MKVLWFANTPCGAVRKEGKETFLGGWLVSLEDKLKKTAGVDLYVAYYSDTSADWFEYENVRYCPLYCKPHSNLSNVFLLRVPSFITDRKQRNQLEDVLVACRPDIVHIHGTEYNFGLIADVAKSMGIPVVFSIQGLMASVASMFFGGVQKKTVRLFDSLKDKILGYGIMKKYRYVKYQAHREAAFLSMAEHIAGRTDFDSRATYLFNQDRRYYVVNEILRPEFYNAVWKGRISSDRKVRIATTLSYNLYKGLDIILKAASLISSLHPEVCFEWTVAGMDRDSKFVRITEKEVGIISEDVHIFYAGMMNSGGLAEMLSQADIYVQASYWENSPNSLCEAMLVGIPSIASAAGGTASLLTDGVEGILYPLGDHITLAGDILFMISNPSFAAECAEKARVRALGRHCPEAVLQELLSCYNSIITSERI